MTTRLLTVLLAAVLFAPWAAVSSRTAGPGGALELLAAEQALLGARAGASRLVADEERDEDWLGSGGADPVARLPGAQPFLGVYDIVQAPSGHGAAVRPCGLWAGPRQPTGPPLRS